LTKQWDFKTSKKTAQGNKKGKKSFKKGDDVGAPPPAQEQEKVPS